MALKINPAAARPFFFLFPFTGSFPVTLIISFVSFEALTCLLILVGSFRFSFEFGSE